MFKVIVLSLLIAGCSVNAEPTKVASPELLAKRKELCSTYGELAKLAMTQRQIGISMESAMKGESSPRIDAIVSGAYKVMRYNHEDNRRDAIQDYENEIYSACYEALIES